MLEKPDIQDEKITECLKDQYGMQTVRVGFLPLGADHDTAVYKVITDKGFVLFIKLRRGAFHEALVAIPRLLYDQGVSQVIPSKLTVDRKLWVGLDGYSLIVYPYIEGQTGFDKGLSDKQWSEFGQALRNIHNADIPNHLLNLLSKETFSPEWREIVKRYLDRIESENFTEPTAAKLAEFIKTKKTEIVSLIKRADQLGLKLLSQPHEFVLCHADMHGGNILIDAKDNLYIVDWDTLTLAPKERDLMFIEGGIGAVWNEQRDSELFYQGYGKTEIDMLALTYFRCERIIQDIYSFCERILFSDEGGRDREQGLEQLMKQFLPDYPVDRAFKTERLLPDAIREYI